MSCDDLCCRGFATSWLRGKVCSGVVCPVVRPCCALMLGGSPTWEKRGDKRAGVCQGGCEDKSQPHLCEGPALTAQEKCLPGQMYSDTVLAWIFFINSPRGLFIQEFA